MILFRRELVLDTDAREIARVKLILEQNSIPYEVKTTVSDNAMSRSFNAAAAVKWRQGYSDMSRQSYIYRLYVPVKSYAAAKKLI